MITLNVFGFLAMVAVVLVVGVVLAVRAHRAAVSQDAAVARFIRDVEVNDAAEMGEFL